MGLSYNSREFSYNVRQINFGAPKFLVYLYINCNGVSYQLAEKNKDFGVPSELAAKKKIMKLLKQKCAGTHAENKMKQLPIFNDGYQESLF